MNPGGTFVRLLSREDAAALWDLRLRALESEPAAFTATAEQHRRMPMAEFAARIEPGDQGNAVFGAFDGNKLVGMAGIYRPSQEADSVRIWGMFVSAKSRGQGLGRELIRRLLEYARNVSGVSAADLHVAPSQHTARHLYLSCGFRPTGTTENGHEHMSRLLSADV